MCILGPSAATHGGASFTTLRLGEPLDKNTDVGAINSLVQLAKIRELAESGEAEGATRWSPPCRIPERGYWFAPTIFIGVSPAHRIDPSGDFRTGEPIISSAFTCRATRTGSPIPEPAG